MWINLGVLCVHWEWVDCVVVPTAALVCACMHACVRACLHACVRACVLGCASLHVCMCVWMGRCVYGWVGGCTSCTSPSSYSCLPLSNFSASFIPFLRTFHSVPFLHPPMHTLCNFHCFITSLFFLSSFYPHSFSSSIKLMTSGRMKGQAFVSYSSTEEATEALEETNGYKLQDKPIVVVSSNYSTTTGPYNFTIN